MTAGAVHCLLSTPSRVGTAVRLPTSGDVDGHTLVVRTLSGKSSMLSGLSSYSSARIVVGTLARNGRIVSVLTTKATVHFLATCLDDAPNVRAVAKARQVRRHPVRVLIGTLHRLKTRVRCIQGRNFPPLQVRNARLANDRVALGNGIDSRCVSTLLVVNPMLGGNLRLQLAKRVISEPCVGLALRLVGSFNTSTS